MYMLSTLLALEGGGGGGGDEGEDCTFKEPVRFIFEGLLLIWIWSYWINNRVPVEVDLKIIDSIQGLCLFRCIHFTLVNEKMTVIYMFIDIVFWKLVLPLFYPCKNWIWIEILTFLFRKMRTKMSSAKWRTFFFTGRWIKRTGDTFSRHTRADRAVAPQTNV